MFLVISIASTDIASYILIQYGIEISFMDQPLESEKESKNEESSEDSKIEIFSSDGKSHVEDLYNNKRNFNKLLLRKGNLHQELNNPPPELT